MGCVQGCMPWLATMKQWENNRNRWSPIEAFIIIKYIYGSIIISFPMWFQSNIYSSLNEYVCKAII